MAEDSKSTADWRKLYTDLVKSLALETESHDKRKHARLLVPDEIDLVIEIGAESHEVIDISPGKVSVVAGEAPEHILMPEFTEVPVE